MSKEVPGNNKHLTLSDRIYIEHKLDEDMSFKEIAKYLCKDPSTIAREVKKHTFKTTSASFKNVNYCIHKTSCKKYNLCNNRGCIGKKCSVCNLCNRYCPDFEPDRCYKRMHKAPFVCNGCPSRQGCRQTKTFYNAVGAEKEYKDTLSDSRSGINMTPDELQRIDDLISPLIMRGQPVYHIYQNHKDEIPFCEKTIYNHINNGILSAKRIDLRRAVKYKKRYSAPNKEPFVPSKMKVGRTFDDFGKYLSENPDVMPFVVQIDTVMGPQGTKASLLTIHFKCCNLQLAFLLDEHTSQNVCDVFDYLEMKLGTDLFRKVFPVILCDNGTEFSNPEYIELSADGSRRTKVFFCEPYSSWQKGSCEKNHEYIRYVIPKGTSMDSFTQADINLMMNHINSTYRPQLNGECPYKLAKALLGDDFLKKLSIRHIKPNDINLTPDLLK